MEIRRLNTLRGLAALIVVVSHFSNSSALWNNLLGQGAGQLGVMLFFLLSGFLMAHLYWERKPDRRNMLSYAVSRAARVVPLYLLIVLLSFTTSYAYNIENVRVLFSHLLFLHGNGVLWTIPPEMQFYFLFGLVWFLAWQQRTWLPPLLIVVFIAAFLLNGASDTTIEFFGFPVTPSIIKAAPYFTLGCVFGVAYKHRRLLVRYQSSFYLLALLIPLALYPNIAIALFEVEHDMWGSAWVWGLIGITFFCVTFLVPDRNAILENKAGDFIGRVSYSLYLLHAPLLLILIRAGWVQPQVLSLLVFTAVALLAAWVSFVLIEAPSRKAIRGIVAHPGAERRSERKSDAQIAPESTSTQLKHPRVP